MIHNNASNLNLYTSIMKNIEKSVSSLGDEGFLLELA